eukprot:6817126-Karenia_brevis.AAC.1
MSAFSCLADAKGGLVDMWLLRSQNPTVIQARARCSVGLAEKLAQSTGFHGVFTFVFKARSRCQRI